MKKILFAAGLAICATSAAQASVIVGAVSASASSTYDFLYDIGRSIDQTGLDSNYTSGVTDFDTYIGSDPVHSSNAINQEWFSEIGMTSSTLIFDLGRSYMLDRIALWNEESGGFSSALVSGSVDGLSYTSLTSIAPTNNPADSAYSAEVFSLGSTNLARFIKLDLSSCPQPTSTFDGCSLGEIAFSAQVPIPGAALFLVTGMGGLAALRRRQTV